MAGALWFPLLCFSQRAVCLCESAAQGHAQERRVWGGEGGLNLLSWDTGWWHPLLMTPNPCIPGKPGVSELLELTLDRLPEGLTSGVDHVELGCGQQEGA